MAEVTNELIYDVLKRMQERLSNIESGVGDVRAEINALRVHSIAMQTDMSNIYARLGSLDARVERIERRLDIADAPAL
ncbi:MAG: hypothetical protein HC829_07170 [Bacteroidales bacterium]|nr:hypothetical protein [Bacteroidales bacterium]